MTTTVTNAADPTRGSSPSSQQEAWSRSRGRLIPAVLVGTTLEWYDVFIYAQAAALIFGGVFFPTSSAAMGTLLAFATYGVGYLARPVGAVIFGHVGDRLGRRTALMATLLLMGFSTTLIGVLPTYDQVGLLAPTLLVVLRLLQGVGAGAEYAGSFVMIAEMVPARRRGFLTAIPGSGIYAGIVVASFVGTITFTMEQSWAWRLPFLLSVVLIVVGFFFRMRIAESPVFEELEQERSRRGLPVVDVIRRTPRRLFLAVLLTAPIGFNSYVVLTYSLSYSVGQGMAKATALWGTLIASALAVFLVPLFGALTDRFGRRPVYLVVALSGAATAFPYFLLLGTGETWPTWAAQALLALTCFTTTGVQAAYLAELFPASVRYSGVALSREICTAALAAPAPVVATALAAWSGGPWLTAALMVLACLACAWAVLQLPETRGSDLSPQPLETAA
jgi:MHS family shikimate/dehydroshikimate transporter-like MFS transporter